MSKDQLSFALDHAPPGTCGKQRITSTATSAWTTTTRNKCELETVTVVMLTTTAQAALATWHASGRSKDWAVQHNQNVRMNIKSNTSLLLPAWLKLIMRNEHALQRGGGSGRGRGSSSRALNGSSKKHNNANENKGSSNHVFIVGKSEDWCQKTCEWMHHESHATKPWQWPWHGIGNRKWQRFRLW